MNLSAGKLWGMRRMADAHGRFKMTAVDQRPPIKNPIKEKLGTPNAPWEPVAEFKKILIEELQNESSAMLLDPHYAYPHGVPVYNPAKGLIMTLEDSVFKETAEGRISSEIDHWSVDKIKRVGGDAVKVLTWYRPDAPAHINQQQKDFTARIGDACARFDIPFVFELLLYPLANDAEKTKDYVEMKSKKPDLVIQSVLDFADSRYGVDLFKLESPIPASDIQSANNENAKAVQSLFNALGEAAGRPWVMLSAGANKDDFRDILTHAYKAGASGYLAGRAIWLDAFTHFPDWSAIRKKLRQDSIRYMASLNELTDTNAIPWMSHPIFAENKVTVCPADESFRRHYKSMREIS